MPNKTVNSWTQVPVTAAEIVATHFDRGPGSNITVWSLYEIKDNGGTVRAINRLTPYTIASYNAFVPATHLANINTQEGT